MSPNQALAFPALTLAGVPGVEPGTSVLETDMLPITPYSLVELWCRRRDSNSQDAEFKSAAYASSATSACNPLPTGRGTVFGGRYRNRTCVDGFAIHRLHPLGQATRKSLKSKGKRQRAKVKRAALSFFLFVKYSDEKPSSDLLPFDICLLPFDFSMIWCG